MARHAATSRAETLSEQNRNRSRRRTRSRGSARMRGSKISVLYQGMHQRGFWNLGEVSDEQLVGSLRELVIADARCEAHIVAHLAELDARRLTLKRAQSLFEYCQKQLGFS